jgi:hypothetical protein
MDPHFFLGVVKFVIWGYKRMIPMNLRVFLDRNCGWEIFPLLLHVYYNEFLLKMYVHTYLFQNIHSKKKD